MPIEVGLWKVNDDIEKIGYQRIESERKLEEILEKDLCILDDKLLLLDARLLLTMANILICWLLMMMGI